MAAKFLPYLLAGISVGGQYALIAIGYTTVGGCFAFSDSLFSSLWSPVSSRFRLVYLAPKCGNAMVMPRAPEGSKRGPWPPVVIIPDSDRTAQPRK